ncbi:hypothetical protein GCM10010434_073960 [Winogradskya humida]
MRRGRLQDEVLLLGGVPALKVLLKGNIARTIACHDPPQPNVTQCHKYL